MAADLSERVRAIASARDMPESEVFEQALERGLEGLYRDVVIGQYLDGEISRDEAVDRVGEATVTRATEEAAAVENDVEWGANA